MGQSTEDIEAKLAAFVDGELDAAGRDDIEKHLQANPQHRVLLDDLMRGRSMLRDLPRETAPADILESIQGHLERRLLLDEKSDEAESSGPGRLRSYLAVAAVFLLTATLGIVIYSVLPNSRQSTDLAATLDRAEARRAESEGADAASVESAAAPPESRVGGNPRVGLDQPIPDGALHDRALAAATDAIRGDSDVPAPAAGRRTEPDVARLPSISEPTLPDPRVALSDESALAPVILLASDDPTATERELSSLLLNNRVMFEQVRSGSDTASPATEEKVDDARGALAQAKENSGESIFVARKLTRSQYQAIEQALKSPVRARQQAVGPAVQEQYQSSRFGSDQQAGTPKRGGIAPGFDRENELTKDNLGKSEGETSRAGAYPESNTAAGAESPVPASQPVDVVRPGDTLLIDVPLQAQSNAGGSQSVEVAADGSMQVPPFEPIAVAGLTTEEIAKKLRTVVGEDALMAGAAVSVIRQPDESALTDVVIVVRPTGEFTEEAAPGVAPVAQPSVDEPGPAEPPADQPALPVPASTMPATQPQ